MSRLEHLPRALLSGMSAKRSHQGNERQKAADDQGDHQKDTEKDGKLEQIDEASALKGQGREVGNCNELHINEGLDKKNQEKTADGEGNIEVSWFCKEK